MGCDGIGEQGRKKGKHGKEQQEYELTWRHGSSNPPPQAGPPTSPFHTSPGCPGPHPTWPQTPPRMDGASTASLGSCSAPPHSHSKELPPHIQPQSALLQLHTISPRPAVICPFQELPPLLFGGSLEVLEGCNEVTPQPSLLQAQQAQLPQPVFVGEVLQPSVHLCLTQLLAVGLVGKLVFIAECSVQCYAKQVNIEFVPNNLQGEGDQSLRVWKN